ncbi:MAG: aspartate kinase [Sphaerochaetaceae bacterium]|nr:aspartate kinase [Sphaerochaetaceae bacterium]
MKKTVLKFGGSSLADSGQFKKVRDIILSEDGKTYVVVSAPGKRSPSDTKVTDMLYSAYDAASRGRNYSEILENIRRRYLEIVTALEISFDLDKEISEIAKRLETDPQVDYVVSRGEYLNARIFSAFLGFEFVEPAECVFFNADGTLNQDRTYSELNKKLENLDHAVIAGFYGAFEDGRIHTFSRGGSDISGSIAARAVNADVYENWTDVSGMLSADPRIVKNPKSIETISYRELRELSYMGASVMHEEAVFPVRAAGIPINIRNTNRPEDRGTWIVSHNSTAGSSAVTGIAGKKGFSTLLIEKAMMNNEVGFVAKLLNIFASRGVSVEHIPTGIDTITAVVDSDGFKRSKSEILDEIKEQLNPDTVIVESGLVLIAVVGVGMVYKKGVSATLFTALADADVNVRMIDQGSSEMNIIIAVDDSDYGKAVNAIYSAFFA